MQARRGSVYVTQTFNSFPVASKTTPWSSSRTTASFQFFPSCFRGGREGVEQAVLQGFQFFPSCFDHLPQRRAAPAHLQLSILSQLLQGKEGTSRSDRHTCLLCFQFFPSCFRRFTFNMLMVKFKNYAFNSFPVASRRWLSRLASAQLCFQFFPSCFLRLEDGAGQGGGQVIRFQFFPSCFPLVDWHALPGALLLSILSQLLPRGLFLGLLISFSSCRQKFAKLPRTVHLHMRGFWPSRRVNSQIPA